MSKFVKSKIFYARRYSLAHIYMYKIGNSVTSNLQSIFGKLFTIM